MDTEAKPKLNLRTKIVQTFSMPLTFEHETYMLHGKYEQDTKKHNRLLEISIADFTVGTSRQGLYATFEQGDEGHFADVRGANDYWHNQELQKVFEEYVQPMLEENLPPHMKKLMHFDE